MVIIPSGYHPAAQEGDSSVGVPIHLDEPGNENFAFLEGLYEWFLMFKG